ncbi:drug/metabolite transporter (DMT)-like permease [Acidipila rosea]|uniref:Drug/metabolite transporter (DMT)-like permease n=1 Tax=Acidipila rosea TaxID=768535 RepID=A0A4R1L8R1_9BACT|nr:drug/metabolite transporter (DMT)-like permease [Acidipila rosea]
MSQSLRAHVLLLAVVVVWGSTFVLVKGALTDVSPLLFNLLRMTIAFVALAIFYRSHWRRMTRRAVISGAVVGACLAMGYQFQTAGLRMTTPSKSAFLTGLVVVLVPLLSAVPGLRPHGAHPPRWNAYLGALLAFDGIVLLTTPAGATFDFRAMNRGDLLTLGCALGFALHVIALAHTSPRMDYEQLALLQIGFCTVYMAVSLHIFEHPYIHWTGRLLIALGIAALLATAAAFTIQSWAQQFLPATHTALILALEPVFAWLTSFAVMGERLNLRSSSGAIFILGGIALTEILPARIQPTAHEGVSLSEK